MDIIKAEQLSSVSAVWLSGRQKISWGICQVYWGIWQVYWGIWQVYWGIWQVYWGVWQVYFKICSGPPASMLSTRDKNGLPPPLLISTV